MVNPKLIGPLERMWAVDNCVSVTEDHLMSHSNPRFPFAKGELNKILRRAGDDGQRKNDRMMIATFFRWRTVESAAGKISEDSNGELFADCGKGGDK